VIYSTCSSEPEENEAVVAVFLGSRADFALVAVQALPGLDQRVRALATPDGYLRTDPTRGLEAFFAAVLRRN
jgi:16S rRNA (cytosine967-C5)-methyltransferase